MDFQTVTVSFFGLRIVIQNEVRLSDYTLRTLLILIQHPSTHYLLHSITHFG